MFPYTIVPANKKMIPVIVSIPHSGTYMPLDIERRIDDKEMQALPMTDWYLHHLYDFLPAMGATIIYANYSRNVVDMNRSSQSEELYPDRFETKLVAEQTFQGKKIFTNYPTDLQVHHHTINAHQPYHLALSTMLKDYKKRHGKVYLLDLHSIAPHKTLIHDELKRDIYLGDRDGNSCNTDWTDRVAFLFKIHSFSVEKNDPYKGGYITHHYGQDENIEALQIEMNQAVYLSDVMNADPVRPMNNESLSKVLENPDFVKAKQRLAALFEDIFGSMPA